MCHRMSQITNFLTPKFISIPSFSKTKKKAIVISQSHEDHVRKIGHISFKNLCSTQKGIKGTDF